MAKRAAKMKAAGGKKRAVESYDHRDKKWANNPRMGLVMGQTDPDAGQKKTYQYDPQLVWTGKAEIDDELIEAYRGTVSPPFEQGEHKRVAIKIMDDRGINILKIVEVG